MARSKDGDALTPDNGGAGCGAVGGASSAGVGQGPVFGAVGLGRAEKGRVFVLDAGTVSRGVAGGASAACTGRTVSVNLFGLRGILPLGGVVTRSWKEDNVLILSVNAAGCGAVDGRLGADAGLGIGAGQAVLKNPSCLRRNPSPGGGGVIGTYTKEPSFVPSVLSPLQNCPPFICGRDPTKGYTFAEGDTKTIVGDVADDTFCAGVGAGHRLGESLVILGAALLIREQLVGFLDFAKFRDVGIMLGGSVVLSGWDCSTNVRWAARMASLLWKDLTDLG